MPVWEIVLKQVQSLELAETPEYQDTSEPAECKATPITPRPLMRQKNEAPAAYEERKNRESAAYRKKVEQSAPV